ncbi:MAG TPA: DUF5985 family protein [Bacteriovoracaceae bacterium]|nr:DUF5985 family protein [Bacteriovoracaceae bacterium]
MASAVYISCALLSLACSFMLFKGYRQNKFRLLMWTSIGFLGFALNNTLLFIDLIVLRDTFDLSVIRTVPSLVGMVLLVYGLISDTV